MNFILNRWIMRKYDATNIANCVTKKYITQAQADEILATPQIKLSTQ
ncbi:hypothetical protein [Clostridium sp. C2-6-12]|nr:hypothetical protein [Clostridium sp. C2-6-12]